MSPDEENEEEDEDDFDPETGGTGGDSSGGISMVPIKNKLHSDKQTIDSSRHSE
jgi:hypothetical protein